jgi:hypothetical protein
VLTSTGSIGSLRLEGDGFLNKQDLVINVEWDGPFPFSDINKLNGPTDYGIYQIYGGHPVYGNSALLYVGLAAAQTFGKRVPQERHWLDNRDARRVEVYVGRLAGRETPDEDMWGRRIRLAERLLIYAHMPPMNVQKSLGNLACDLRYIHVLNWGYHRDLLPEVSGLRWASLDEDFPEEYHEFTDEEPE